MRYALKIIVFICCLVPIMVGQAISKHDTDTTPALPVSNLTGMRLCVVENNPPFAFRDDNDELQGFNVDVWNAINIPYAFSYKSTDLPTALAALEGGYCHMVLSNISITPERLRRFSMSEPYLRSSIGIMVRDADSSITSMDDLQNKTIAVLKGSTSEHLAMHTLKGGEVLALRNKNKLYDALTQKIADAVIDDMPVMQHFLIEGHGRGRILDLKLQEQYYAYGFSKGLDPVRNSVNAAIIRLNNEGTIAKLYEKWFGTSPTVTHLVKP